MRSMSMDQWIVVALVGAAVLYLARNAWHKLVGRRRGDGPKPACGAECGCGEGPVRR